MMFTPLNVNTHYSLQKGFGKPNEVAKKCAANNYSACAITDYNSLSGVVNHYTACVDNKVKPILGMRVRVKGKENSGYANVIAQNLNGWRKLLEINYEVASSDKEEISYEKLLDIEDCLVVLGGQDGIKDEYLFKNIRGKAYYGTDRLRKGEVDLGLTMAEWNNMSLIAMPTIMYAESQDKIDQLTLYYANLGITSDVKSEDADLLRYQQFDYSIPSADILSAFSKAELDGAALINSLCEEFSILGKPRIPKFACPNDQDSTEYLLELCRAGWLRLNDKIDKNRINEYVDRIKKETAVISKANLADYFLIVQDYVMWAKNQGWLVGCGRGSAGGCLISYLTGITSIDPIIYDLLFERFYNDGRNTADKVSLPDIDVDFPRSKRKYIFDYIRQKYTAPHVSQVITFSGLQGKSAIKEVLRIHNACPQAVMDKIGKCIPSRDKISDKLEEDNETSVLRWTLIHEGEKLQDWVQYDDDYNLVGDMAKYFEQAIRIENTYKSYGKHASALVISSDPIREVCPMVREKNGEEMIAAIAYTEMEQMGLPKMDILGIATLEKLMFVKEFLKGKNE